MRKVYDTPSLPFYNELDLILKDYIEAVVGLGVKTTLLGFDKSWAMHQIQSPLLIPKSETNLDYEDYKLFSLDDYHLRPETTEATYAYARLMAKQETFSLPVCYWQHSRSARPDEPSMDNIYMKEFYQLEYQCLFRAQDIDYTARMAEQVLNTIEFLSKSEVRMVKVEEAPTYANVVYDIEIEYRGRWIEVASVLERTDTGIQDTWNLEVGIGTDRLIQILETE